VLAAYISFERNTASLRKPVLVFDAVFCQSYI